MSNSSPTAQHANQQRNERSSVQSPAELQPRQDLVDYMKQYAKEKPEVMAMWCFGVGFILGWKLKPW